jgi:hypothetical protein
MKKILFPATVLFTLVFGCSAALADRPVDDVRDLPAFEGIGISVSADVYYTQGNQHEIRIEGDEDDVRDLITEVEDGFLKIRYEDNWGRNRSKLTIYITSSEISSLKISGSAKFMAEKQVNTEEMDISLSGSGGATFNQLSSDEMEIKISGSGFVVLAGEGADELDIKLSGSGRLSAEKFRVSEVNTAISGSGSCKVYATEALDAKISGSGSVHYRGNPQINSVTSGSGKVVSM